MNFNIHIADDLHKKDKNPSSLHSSISTFQINAERDCINAISRNTESMWNPLT